LNELLSKLERAIKLKEKKRRERERGKSR